MFGGTDDDGMARYVLALKAYSLPLIFASLAVRIR
jgi:hypothetical protein